MNEKTRFRKVVTVFVDFLPGFSLEKPAKIVSGKLSLPFHLLSSPTGLSGFSQ